MTPRFFPLIAAASMTAMIAAPGPSLAQTAPPAPAPTFGSLFDPAAIIGGVMRTAVTYARLLADVRYTSIMVDHARRTVTLRGLAVNGLAPNQRCRVEVGQALISGIGFWAEENSAMRFDLADLTITNDCFGPGGLMVGAILGSDRIQIAAMDATLRANLGSGAVQVDLTVEAPDQLRIEASGDFAYLAVAAPSLIAEMQPDEVDETTAPGDGSDTAAQQPEVGLRGTINSAHVTVENLGLWQRVAPMLPSDASDPAQLRRVLTAGIPPDALPYAEDLADALERWLADPARLTVEIRPDAPLDFDTLLWTTPMQAAPALQPDFSNAAPTPPLVLIPPGGPGGPDGARALGLALASGAGVPRNPGRAEELLTPLADDPVVALALADLVAARDPATAYRFALAAAAGQAVGALSALDRIEAQLGAGDLLQAQPGSDAALPDDAFASAPALRAAALMRESGNGAPRSYVQAWMLASLAAAAGDGPARALMDRVEARFGSDPAWITARDAAADRAAALWDEKSLATALAAP